MTKTRAVVGIIGSLMLCFLGFYQLVNDSQNTVPLALSLIFAIGGPISAIAMAMNYKKSQSNIG